MAPLKNLVRGDVGLARAIFGDASKRKLIPRLQQEGWPIWTLANKRCAYPAELRAYARRLQQCKRKTAAKVAA